MPQIPMPPRHKPTKIPCNQFARLLVIILQETLLLCAKLPRSGNGRHATWCMHTSFQCIFLVERQKTTNSILMLALCPCVCFCVSIHGELLANY